MEKSKFYRVVGFLFGISLYFMGMRFTSYFYQQEQLIELAMGLVTMAGGILMIIIAQEYWEDTRDTSRS